MLLVDHDQPEVLQGSEYGGARPHAHAGLSLPKPPPLVVALSLARRRMQDGHLRPQPSFEAADQLRGEPDLWHQHDRATACLERGLDRPEVDLCLAGAGDAVEQESPAARRQRPQNLLQGSPLLVGQRGGTDGCGAYRRTQRATRQTLAVQDDQPAPLEAAQQPRRMLRRHGGPVAAQLSRAARWRRSATFAGEGVRTCVAQVGHQHLAMTPAAGRSGRQQQ